MTNACSGVVTLRAPRDLTRWFSRRPLLAERTALALARHMADVRADLGLTAPGAWLDWVRGYRVDQVARVAAWDAWQKGGRPEAEYPSARQFRVPVWTRDPPLPPATMLYGAIWKTHPRNTCPVCRCSTYADGDWREPAGKPRWNKTWHACCVVAHGIWRNAGDAAHYLAVRQGGVCPITGEAILRTREIRGEPVRELVPGVQVDHVVPLWRVRVDAARHAWPDVLRFWGASNLQALSMAGHARKTAQEARERAALAKAATPAQLSLLSADVDRGDSLGTEQQTGQEG